MKDIKNDQHANGGKLLQESKEEKKNINLEASGVASALAKRIQEDIDAYCVKTYDGGHRWHLGASLIGDECKRKLWYIFRWCKREITTGRQQRLFNRGHREEDRFIEWLEGIGFQVWADDLQNNTLWLDPLSNSYILLPANELPPLTECQDVSNIKQHVKRAKADGLEFPQYRISGVNGHFGGSLDGIAICPERYRIKEPVLLEFKTNGTGKGFNDLCTQGMPVAKPLHFSQTSTYGEDYKFNFVIYLNINKNDDSLHVEVTKLDHNLGQQMKYKAEQIIISNEPPPKLSENPTFYKCKWCHFSGICHGNEQPEINCRSCKKAIPVENGQWFCLTHEDIIPREFVYKACNSFKAITDNV